MSLTEPASPDLRHIFPTFCPCANTSNAIGQPCDKVGVKACSGCFLVSYCSKECQTRHWKQHKADCKSALAAWKPVWEKEQRIPCFLRLPSDPPDVEDPNSAIGQIESYGKKKYLWGNMPSFDVLRMEQNEGAGYENDINLLFAASGDLRNVIKTINGVPPASTQHIKAIINDFELDIVARNAILLLTALYVESPSVASSTMLHTWYSAFLPSSVLHVLRTTVLPLIQDVCAKIADKPADKLLSKTFVRHSCSIRIVLEKRNWFALRQYFELPDGLDTERAARIRTATVLEEKRKDYLDRTMIYQTPGYRAAKMRFRYDGVLMPFGAARQMFDTPNPTFFQEPDVWPMLDNAEPLSGWSLDDILKNTPLATNDLYGGMFFHLKEVLLSFFTKLRSLKISFVLLHIDAADLPNKLATDFHLTQSFDRIELSNITDLHYLGLRCLPIFAPLLRPPHENPAAALLTLFMNLTDDICTEADTIACMRREMSHVLPYLPPERKPKRSETDYERLRAASHLFEDFDGVLARYKKLVNFDAVAKFSGLQAKSKHTIIDPWPLRLRRDLTKAEFEKSFATTWCGSEHYIEWQRLPVTADGVANGLPDDQCVVC